MSRIGKLPISIPTGVEVKVSDKNLVLVKGKNGELKESIHPDMKVVIEDNQIVVHRPTDQTRHKALHGLSRALINNMIVGVSTGYKIDLEIIGVGYKATNKGQILELSLGYSHDIHFQLPNEVAVETITEKGKAPLIKLSSNDKQLIGMVATKIRSYRMPEPYKGKGILYKGEQIRRKAGKSNA